MESKFLDELNKYESVISEKDKKSGYTVVTKKIFEQETTDDEITVLSILSLLSEKEVWDNKIKVLPFKTRQILDFLNIETKNPKRYVDRIESALHSLIEKGVLSTYKESETKYYLYQNIGEKGFFQIGTGEIITVLDSEYTTNFTIKILADYTSICSKIFATKNFDNAQHFVNYESLSTIAKRRGAERRSVAKSIQALIDIKVLAFYKVARKGETETKYILSRYSHKAMLRKYVESEIKKGNYYLIANNTVSNEFDFDFEVVKAEDPQPQKQELHSELQRIAEVLNVETFSKKYINKFNQILKSNDEQSVHNAINYLLSDKYFKDLAFEKDTDKYMNTMFKQFDKFLKKGQAKQVKDEMAQNVLSIDRTVAIDCEEDEEEATTDEWYALVK